MKGKYYTLLYCRELEKNQSSDEMLEIVRERVKHLYDSESRTPMLSDYLAPEALCEDEPIAFGAEKPETVIRWATEMEKLNRTDAWETVSRFREQIENSCVEPEMCDMLSKAFELLSGTVNEETNYLLVDEFDLICPWPNQTHLQDIKNKPEQWVLCRIAFRPEA